MYVLQNNVNIQIIAIHITLSFFLTIGYNELCRKSSILDRGNGQVSYE